MSEIILNELDNVFKISNDKSFLALKLDVSTLDLAKFKF